LAGRNPKVIGMPNSGASTDKASRCKKRKVVEVEYQATPGLSLNGVFSQSGGFAADIRIRKAW
jgi:hypothetical protein